ncbi:MAG: hypothetical protein HND48_25700 [Chloroflexi bacterium]|nr:hypothetical protein [Chloroflexota bacterium]
MNGTFLTGDIFTFFVFMEPLVVTSVVLVAGSDNPDGIEAATKYLLISACGTLFLLIGIAMIYGSFGTLNMADIARLSAETGGTGLTNASAVVLMCAFLLKGAVFPFHFWQPDFHTTGARAAVCAAVVGGGQGRGVRLAAPDHPAARIGPDAAPRVDHAWPDRHRVWRRNRFADTQRQAYSGVFDAGADRVHPARDRLGHAAGAGRRVDLRLQSRADQVGAADVGGACGEPYHNQDVIASRQPRGRIRHAVD